MTNTPWWDSIPHDLYQQANPTPINQRFPLLVGASKTMDWVMRSGLAAAVSASMAKDLLSPKRLNEEYELLQFYRALTEPADAGKVFLTPPKNVPVEARPLPLLGYHPKEVPAVELHFDSPYHTLNSALGAAYQRHHHNRHLRAQYWRHSKGGRPTLIFIHGVTVNPYWLNSWMFSLKWFYRQGFDILLYTLPFHGKRRGRGDLFSGQGFFSHGLAHVNEAMLQSVYDLRIWVNYLLQQGSTAVGVSSLSLGGYITALAVGAEPRLAFAIPNAPVVMPVDMLLEWPFTAPLIRRVMAHKQLTLADMRQLMALHCPLTWQSQIATEKLLIISGAGDRFTAPHYVTALHEHWQGSRLHWFPGNHLVHLQQGRYLRVMRDFMVEATETAKQHTSSALLR